MAGGRDMGPHRNVNGKCGRCGFGWPCPAAIVGGPRVESDTSVNARPDTPAGGTYWPESAVVRTPPGETNRTLSGEA